MTRAEFNAKYGEYKVRFCSYYKFKFCFEYVSPDEVLVVYVGGIADDIYRFDVQAGREVSVSDLEPDCAYLNGELIYDE